MSRGLGGLLTVMAGVLVMSGHGHVAAVIGLVRHVLRVLS